MSLCYAQTPGLIPQPASALAAGAVLSSLPLSVIQSNTDFANVGVEVFYQELRDGDAVTLPASLVDGYQYSASECIYHWERRSTVSSPGGYPAAAGGILEIADWVDPASLKASVFTPYMVQGGTTSDTNDGILALWIFGVRGRGLITIPSGLAFTYQDDSAFAPGQPLTPALLQAMSASAQRAAVQFEVFTDAGQGTTWTPGWTPAANAYMKPTWSRANGCYYQAAEVIGPTALIEPTWPTKMNSVIIDGGVIWVCVGRGFTNGQQFSMPASPVDGHVYSSAEMVACVTSWISTGQANGTGPSGKGRIQRLQKSAPGGLVSTTVTYWDGNNQDPTTDGIVHCVGIFQRALPTYATTPPAYNIFDGDEFMSGHGLAVTETGQTSNDAQLLNQNIKNAAVRPEGFWNTGKASAQAPALPTSWSGYAYKRSELMNVYELADTGAVASGVDRALRLFTTLVDPASGLITLRTDYYQGGAPVTSANGALNIAVIGRRDENVLLGGMAVIGLGGSPGEAPIGQNGVPNGSFEIWADLLHSGQQLVAVPSLWSISNSTQDGYTTQQPGIDSMYGVGLDVGNSHAPANQQWISPLSYPIAVTAGDSYSWNLLAFANPGISTGFIVRLHLRDINFANDVAFDLVPNQALGSSATRFGFRFTMPGAGDTVLHTASGLIPINGGAVPAQVTYAYIEIWNYKPNVSSTVICDDCQLTNLGGIADIVPVANSNPSAPTLSYTPGGSLPARTYYVQFDYNYHTRFYTTVMTSPSAQASIAIPANNLLVVAAPPAALNNSSWNVFVGAASGAETEQNTSEIAAGANWTEPTSGLISGTPLIATNWTGGTGTSALPSGGIMRRALLAAASRQSNPGFTTGAPVSITATGINWNDLGGSTLSQIVGSVLILANFTVTNTGAAASLVTVGIAIGSTSNVAGAAQETIKAGETKTLVAFRFDASPAISPTYHLAAQYDGNGTPSVQIANLVPINWSD